MATSPITVSMVQGETFLMNFTLNDPNGVAIDLTNSTVRGKIRKTASSEPSLVDFTCALTDAVHGKGSVSLTAAQTSALPTDKSATADRMTTQLAFDVEVVYSDNVTVERIIQGIIALSPEVTR